MSHMFQHRNWVLIAIGGAILTMAPVLAQSEDQEPDSNVNQAAPLNPLAGPQADNESGSNDTSSTDNEMSGLIELTFDGRVIEIGPDPVRAILDRMRLTPQQRERFEELKIERSLLLDRLAREHYSMLLEFGAAASSGELEENPFALALNLDHLSRAFHGFFERGSLLTEMHGALTPRQRWQATKTLGEYRRAQVRERRQVDGDERGTFEILVDIRFDELGKQLEESFESRAAMMQDEFDQFIRYLALTPDQVAQVEAIYQEIGVREFLGEEVSGAEQLAAYTQLHDILTHEQRIKVRKLFLAGGRIEDVMDD